MGAREAGSRWLSLLVELRLDVDDEEDSEEPEEVLATTDVVRA